MLILLPHYAIPPAETKLWANMANQGQPGIINSVLTMANQVLESFRSDYDYNYDYDYEIWPWVDWHY